MRRGPRRLVPDCVIEKDSPSYTQDFIDGLHYQEAVSSEPKPLRYSSYIRLPHHRIGDLVLVWPGNDRDNPSYIGKVLDVRKKPEDFYFWYKVERPDGTVEGYVNEEWVSREPAKEALEIQVRRLQGEISQAQIRVAKLQEAVQWAEAGDTGFLNRDYQHKPPKKAKGGQDVKTKPTA